MSYTEGNGGQVLHFKRRVGGESSQKICRVGGDLLVRLRPWFESVKCHPERPDPKLTKSPSYVEPDVEWVDGASYGKGKEGMKSAQGIEARRGKTPIRMKTCGPKREIDGLVARRARNRSSRSVLQKKERMKKLKLNLIQQEEFLYPT